MRHYSEQYPGDMQGSDSVSIGSVLLGPFDRAHCICKLLIPAWTDSYLSFVHVRLSWRVRIVDFRKTGSPMLQSFRLLSVLSVFSYRRYARNLRRRFESSYLSIQIITDFQYRLRYLRTQRTRLILACSLIHSSKPQQDSLSCRRRSFGGGWHYG